MRDETTRAWTSTGHARFQARRRGIPDAAVSWVIEHYHTRRPAPPRDAALPADILIGVYNGRDLKVYVERGSDPPKVKTVVWDG